MRFLLRASIAITFGIILLPHVSVARDAQVAQAQLLLTVLGFDPGPVDGSIGGRTTSALADFLSARGLSFDGALDEGEMDALYTALSEIRFNGESPELSAADGKTSFDPAFDFIPERDLAAEYEPVAAVDPDALYELLRKGAAPARSYCGYNPLDGFPAAGETLHTYGSMREFETTAKRRPHPGNSWLEDLSFAAQRAGPGAALADRAAIEDLRVALLAHSAAGTGLDTASLVDKSGRVIVVPDFGTGVMVATSLTASYLLAAPGLGLTDAEKEQIETWLHRLFESFPDSHFKLTGEGSKRDPLGIVRVGNAMMLHAMMRGDPDEFNEGARLALTALSFVRPDGSDRLGASRGPRALFYQGTALMHAMESYVLLNSQGVPADELLGPTVLRMAEFWGQSWNDHDVLLPYARENNAVYVGANYREQEVGDPSEGLDLFLAVGGDEAFGADLKAIRETYEFSRQFGASFNETCIAFTLDPQYRPVKAAN